MEEDEEEGDTKVCILFFSLHTKENVDRNLTSQAF